MDEISSEAYSHFLTDGGENCASSWKCNTAGGMMARLRVVRQTVGGSAEYCAWNVHKNVDVDRCFVHKSVLE